MRLLASGRDADVFALDDDRVLRRCRHGQSVSDREVSIMRHLWRLDYPVPRVLDVDGGDLVMQRLHGPTLMEAVFAGDAGGGRVLADLHNRLHAVPAPAWLGDGQSVLHMDLHPLNVIVTENGPHVVDWSNAQAGDPALDVADMVVITRSVSAEKLGFPEFESRRDDLLAQFLAYVDHDPTPRIDAAATKRLTDPNFNERERDRMRALLA